MEHRWGARHAFDGPVRLIRHDGIACFGQLRDVSLSGAFVETRAPLDLLSPLQVSIPVDGYSLQLKAWTVRADALGYGLEWHDGETLDLDLLLMQVTRRARRLASARSCRTGDARRRDSML